MKVKPPICREIDERCAFASKSIALKIFDQLDELEGAICAKKGPKRTQSL
jgi:hypothetical protein